MKKNKNSSLQEEREKGNIKMETLLTYARNMNYILLVIFFIFNFGMQFSRNLVDFWLKDETSEKHGSFFTNFNNYFDNSF
jgi:hypothetical protein